MSHIYIMFVSGAGCVCELTNQSSQGTQEGLLKETGAKRERFRQRENTVLQH